MENNMKIGDKVKLIDNKRLNAPVGSTARVIGTKAPYIQIKWIDKGDSDQMDGNYYPKNFEIIEEILPEKWYMRLDNLSSEELKQCNNWRNNVCKTYHDTTLHTWHLLINCHIDGSYYYGYADVVRLKDEDWATGIEEITFEQFKEHYLKQDNKQVMSKQKLTVSVTDVLEIHKIACNTWKEKIANYLSRVNPEQNITLTQREVDKMFEAATGDQEPVLERIFGKKGPATLQEIADGRLLFREDASRLGQAAMIELRVNGDFKNRGFWLNRQYDWKIVEEDGDKILIPTPKN